MEQQERNDQSQLNKGQTEINKGEQRLGRADQDDTHDISHMDQQEGAMNNGALGGNFENSVEEGNRTAGSGEGRNK